MFNDVAEKVEAVKLNGKAKTQRKAFPSNGGCMVTERASRPQTDWSETLIYLQT